MGTPADLQSEWARLVIGSLVQTGIHDAVISPGSRSTPFVVAALEHEGLRCTSAIDERSAAHFALGQARATGLPSLVLCTSGSAPANYFPAVVEANECGVPLVVLSADRPPELHGRGANQTTDQVRMYGTHARFFADLGEPSGDAGTLEATRRVVAEAVTRSRGPRPGPVQLNAPARKPLEPQEASGVEAQSRHARVDAVLAEPRLPSKPHSLLDDSVVARVADALESAKRPLIVCGPADARQGDAASNAARLAQSSGAVLVAEAASQFRFGQAARQALGAVDTIWSQLGADDALLPDFVLQLGRNPIASGWDKLTSATGIPRFAVHPWTVVDPSATAEAILHADVSALLERLASRTYARSVDPAFGRALRRVERAVWEAAKDILHDAGDVLSEAAVAPCVVDALPPQSGLVLGNSLPIRDVDRWVPPGDKPVRVFSQRGVSGIDGVVSGAVGVASCSTGPTALLVGDVSFLHDINGLELAARAAAPLAIVVINNGGGRIFEQLPIATTGQPEWMPYFTTPHGADLGSAAKLYGCEFGSTRSLAELQRLLQGALDLPGCTVIEAVVPSGSAQAQSEQLASRIARVLASEVP